MEPRAVDEPWEQRAVDRIPVRRVLVQEHQEHEPRDGRTTVVQTRGESVCLGLVLLVVVRELPRGNEVDPVLWLDQTLGPEKEVCFNSLGGYCMREPVGGHDGGFAVRSVAAGRLSKEGVNQGDVHGHDVRFMPPFGKVRRGIGVERKRGLHLEAHCQPGLFCRVQPLGCSRRGNVGRAQEYVQQTVLFECPQIGRRLSARRPQRDARIELLAEFEQRFESGWRFAPKEDVDLVRLKSKAAEPQPAHDVYSSERPAPRVLQQDKAPHRWQALLPRDQFHVRHAIPRARRRKCAGALYHPFGLLIQHD